MASLEWVDAVRKLTKEAFDAQSDGWKEFHAELEHDRAKDVAYSRWTPTREYAYLLCKYVRRAFLASDISPAVDEDGLYAQFEKSAYLGTPFLRDMAINDSAVTRSTRYSGNYRLFIAGKNDEYAVYYCLLQKAVGRDGAPQFVMWRETEGNEHRTFRGAFFVNDERLYLVGGRRESIDLRMFIFRINVGEDDTDYHGLSLFVSSSENITAAKCFLEAMKKADLTGPVAPKIRRLITGEELNEISPSAFKYLSTDNNAIVVSPQIDY
ncbi:hypothetical protein [Rhizobium leguminosarum]|uniref:hypothetical protein n=1 Tax=Rhizobium leguminosarum TaxID=384 RepID=UPI001C957162|nr:hypothetical protein [Rhizobium leguminosarum]MBY5710099.1 hypothetical protein [Rhizobium leguminosarum]